MKETIGMPIGIQVIGKPYEEELVLRLMVELERNNGC
jgi:Asp-tRNA(Asn)/Glu-tRNA(Gln) amidotransferase A subunit family amidase